ncbi:hypothetical protein [uncultured Sphingomonas sp.]|uniref:hypothetical protein n=1 Tax=uncultured Sphingomonas sp. TaxID=158754 RepID=UPI0035CA89D7
MTSPAARAIGALQVLSLSALVVVLARPRASWSLRARLPVALLALAASAAHLFLTIL